jgi:DNA-binding SARP family transcriptional activator
MGCSVVGQLEFGVLGPLEVRRDGELVRLGGERQRALLALLLLHANELVTVELLVDQLFGERRSEAAVGAVRVALSRLRRVLENGAGEGGAVQTLPGGYVLQVDPERLDAGRFERLLAEGRDLLAASDSASAAARLREALALWRGPALADVSLLEFAQSESRRLEELRLVAVMERIDADLGLGLDAELIGELEGLIASNPLQERLRGQLMLALYRAGRQAEALAAYRETSELLRDQLGLEPSPGLRELERSILRQESSLELSVESSDDRTAVARRVGSDTELFEREAELDAVARAIASARSGTGRVLLVEAPAGCGKSSLLAAAAARARGFRVFVGRGGEFERDAGFGIVREMYGAAVAGRAPEDALTGIASLAAPVLFADSTGSRPGAEAAAIHHALYWLTADLGLLADLGG